MNIQTILLILGCLPSQRYVTLFFYIYICQYIIASFCTFSTIYINIRSCSHTNFIITTHSILCMHLSEMQHLFIQLCKYVFINNNGWAKSKQVIIDKIFQNIQIVYIYLFMNNYICLCLQTHIYYYHISSYILVYKKYLAYTVFRSSINNNG